MEIAKPSAHPPALPGELHPVDGDSDPEGGLVRRPALLQQSVHQARLILRIVTFQCLVDIGAIYILHRQRQLGSDSSKHQNSSVIDIIKSIPLFTSFMAVMAFF